MLNEILQEPKRNEYIVISDKERRCSEYCFMPLKLDYKEYQSIQKEV